MILNWWSEITKRLPQKPSNIYNMQTLTLYLMPVSFSLLITHNEELHCVTIIYNINNIEKQVVSSWTFFKCSTVLWMNSWSAYMNNVYPTFFDLIGYFNHFIINEHCYTAALSTPNRLFILIQVGRAGHLPGPMKNTVSTLFSSPPGKLPVLHMASPPLGQI